MNWKVEVLSFAEALDAGHIERGGGYEEETDNWFGLTVWWGNVDWTDSVPEAVVVVSDGRGTQYVLPGSQEVLDHEYERREAIEENVSASRDIQRELDTNQEAAFRNKDYPEYE